jgi:hypothetical protein
MWPVLLPHRSRLRWELLALACFGVVSGSACDQPAQRIILGPLPARPIPRVFDEDAGLAIPDGATPCHLDAECSDGIDCTEDECLPPGYCSSRIDNSRCSDNLICDGIEYCDPTQGCVSSPPPSCDDQDTCTIDHCDESVKDCVHDPRDFDHDGEADYHCPGGTDCDDFDPARSMGAAELCGDGIDNDCDGMIDESNCGAVPHDTCSDALDIGAGGSFEVSIVGTVEDYITSCGDMTMRDVVFAFTLSEPQDVKFEARGLLPAGGDEIAALSLQRNCGDASSEVECARGDPGDLRSRALPAGQYYLIGASSAGAVTLVLEASFSPATPTPTNKTCDTALDVGQGGHFAGDFVDVGDDFSGACSTAGQPDVFYALHLNEEHDVEIAAIGGESRMLTVTLRAGCDATAKEWPCQIGQGIVTRIHQLPKGDYILVLEGPSTHEIPFTLDLTVTDPTPPPSGDNCSVAQPLTFGQTQTLSLTTLQNDVDSSCQSDGPDAVFSLSLASAQDLQIRVESGDAVTVSALQTKCGMPLSERVCRLGAPVSMRLHDVPAGDYFMVVDSPSATSMSVTVDALPPTVTTKVTDNDTCETSTEIPSTGGLFSGDTSTLLQDYSASCGGGANSDDAAFQLQLSARQHVVATLDASFDTVLLRFNGKTSGPQCSADVLAACNDDGMMGSDAILDETLPAGTYYYVVDGYKDNSAGPYTLDVSVSDP